MHRPYRAASAYADTSRRAPVTQETAEPIAGSAPVLISYWATGDFVVGVASVLLLPKAGVVTDVCSVPMPFI
jgi:hypothetical protein